MEMTTHLVPVLVVDDQAPFRRAAQAVVDRVDGFNVEFEALSGEEAVEVAASFGDGPALVLMDINLGAGINGIEATRQITAAHPRAVVVLLSTYAVEDLPAGADNCGAAAYVHKEELTPSLLRRIWDEQQASCST
jgi:two-component system, NarL family, invasion response regulator UvrY